ILINLFFFFVCPDFIACESLKVYFEPFATSFHSFKELPKTSPFSSSPVPFVLGLQKYHLFLIWQYLTQLFLHFFTILLIVSEKKFIFSRFFG
ncbi:MAG: hypothetical protein CW341_10710, partial [Bacteroidetes bacterium]|nr:hypothetical protein [Bacteroidota bacterium]